MDYNVAKFFADTYLINNTNLNYTRGCDISLQKTVVNGL